MKNIFYLAAFSCMTLLGMHPAPTATIVITMADLVNFDNGYNFYKDAKENFIANRNPHNKMIMEQARMDCTVLRNYILNPKADSRAVPQKIKHFIDKANLRPIR